MKGRGGLVVWAVTLLACSERREAAPEVRGAVTEVEQAVKAEMAVDPAPPPCEVLIARTKFARMFDMKNAFPNDEQVWPIREIPVCWENVDPRGRDAEPCSWVRNAAARSWEAASRVRFVGWEACDEEAPGIRIRVDDSSQGPYTTIGKTLAGKPHGMVLNFTFEQWMPSCRATRERCVRAIAVHEFGHALGFAHEQNRPDARPDCRGRAEGSPGTCVFCSYDEESVMNYCNRNWNGNGVLSQCDRYSVAALYGAP